MNLKVRNEVRINGLLLFCLLAIFSYDDRVNAISEGGNGGRLRLVPIFAEAQTPAKQGEMEGQEVAISEKSQDRQSSESQDPVRAYNLETGQKIEVKGNTISIYHSTGKELAKNINIARRMDENLDCFSEGFIDIVTKGNRFTIEQQNCSGWYFIEEFITFQYSEHDKKFLLIRFALQYIDRGDSDKEIEEKVYTQKNFGDVFFEDVDIDSLYKHNR